MNTDIKTPKTEKELKKEEQLNKIFLQHGVQCMQQLQLLQFRLISFEDLRKGIQSTLDITNKLLKEVK